MPSNSDILAKFLKTLEPKKTFEPCLGVVIKAPPQLTIHIKSANYTLYPRMLYMNYRLFDDYTRLYELHGEITEQKMNLSASSETPSGCGPHTHTQTSFTASGTYKAKGTIVNTCTLKVGDLVKVTPTENGQMWFVDYKVRKI